MENKNIEHIGIAVKDLEKTAGFYENILGLEKTKTETVEDQGVRIAFSRSEKAR